MASNGNANCLTEKLKGSNEHWRKHKRRLDFRHDFTTDSLGVGEMPEGMFLKYHCACVKNKTKRKDHVYLYALCVQ